MLGVFSSSIVSPPEELVAAGSRTPSPKIKAAELVDRFLEINSSAVSIQIGDDVQLAYTHHNQSPLKPRYHNYTKSVTKTDSLFLIGQKRDKIRICP
jgi:hypothetical protein